MKQHLQIGEVQEYIDNGYLSESDGWEGIMLADATCPVAQALHYQGDYGWNAIHVSEYGVNIVSVRYTISEGVHDWIADFDAWKEGNPEDVSPVPETLVMDTDKHHITLANEEE